MNSWKRYITAAAVLAATLLALHFSSPAQDSGAGKEKGWAHTMVSGDKGIFYDVVVEGNDFIYVAGKIAFKLVDFGDGVTGHGSEETCLDCWTGVLVKYNRQGTPLWARPEADGLGGSRSYLAVAASGKGDIYAAGEGPVLVKYDGQGKLLWERRPKCGYGWGWYQGLAVDRKGYVYAAGYMDGAGDFVFGKGVKAAGITKKVPNSLVDTTLSTAVLVKFDGTGKALWVRQVRSQNGTSYYKDVAVSGNGDIYVVGNILYEDAYSLGNGVTVKGVYTSSTSGVIAKYTSQGTPLWAKTIAPGGGSTKFCGLALDKKGYIYVAGTIHGTTPNTFGPGVSAGGTAPFADSCVLVKYDPAGAALWARSAYSEKLKKDLRIEAGRSQFNAVTVTTGGLVIAAGFVAGSEPHYFSNEVIVAGSSKDNFNALVVAFSGEGEPRWAKSVSTGQSFSMFQGMAADDFSNIFAAGEIQGNYCYTFDKDVAVESKAKSTYDEYPVLVKYPAR